LSGPSDAIAPVLLASPPGQRAPSDQRYRIRLSDWFHRKAHGADGERGLLRQDIPALIGRAALDCLKE
jgi:hypothetical protein